MPTYERYDNDQLVERVVTVADSPNDKRLRESKAWKLAEEGEQAATAPTTEAKPARATTQAKPPAKEA